MTDLTFNDPCVLFAVRREALGFRREFRRNERFPGAPCPAYFCSPRELPELSVLVLETGIGAACARAALEWVLRQPVLENVPYRPKVVISAGFCGALRDGYRVGDVLVATEVTDGAGACRPTTWPGELPPGEWRPQLHRGRLLTVDRIVGPAEEKRRLGETHNADAVDMESAPLADLCRRADVPFGCVRAVSDDIATPLSPRLVSLLARSRVSAPRLLAAVAAGPGLLPELWRLWRDTRRAGEQLGQALGELLTLTLS